MPPCPFCGIKPEDHMITGTLAFALRDGYPVSEGHTLIVPRRHVASLFEVTADELREMADLLLRARERLLVETACHAFNIGVNDGEAAGQTIPHLHVHLIPRYHNDVPDPRGGVRWVIPTHAPYWPSGPLSEGR